MLDNKYYSALPVGEDAEVLFLEYRKLLIRNLIGYLNSIQTSLSLDISDIIDKYEHLEVSHKFSPAIFDLFSKLTYCSSLGDVPPIIDILYQLKILDEVEIYNSDFYISSILSESWERDFVNKLRLDHFPNEKGDTTLILPILNSNLNTYENIYSELSQQLKRVDIDLYQEISTYVTRLKLFNGKAIRGATSASVFGAIYLRLPKDTENAEVYFTDHIVHEASHLHLDILLAFDKIVLNEDAEKFQAPIRIDPRPMFGIFHATFVLCRMIRVFQRIISEKPKKEYIDRLYIIRKQFDQGLETIEKHAILTMKGKLIKGSFIEAAEI